jgi:copper chaperone CopZ
MPVETIQMPVKGMTCGNCARSVERKLSGVRGVTKAAVDLAGEKAQVEYDPSVVRPEALADAVRQLGYEVPA